MFSIPSSHIIREQFTPISPHLTSQTPSVCEIQNVALTAAIDGCPNLYELGALLAFTLQSSETPQHHVLLC